MTATLTVYAGSGDASPGTTFPQMSQQGSAVGLYTLQCDAAADEGCQWPIHLPGYTSGNITATIHWHAETATSGDVVLSVSICAQTANADNIDVSGDAWATANTGTDSHLGTTAKRPHQHDVTISNLDSLADGDRVYLRFRRLGSNGSDTMSGDMHLERIVLVYPNT